MSLNNEYDDEKITLIDSLTCRICYDYKDSELISPCQCSGSIKWIHRDCLEETRVINPDKCPTCNTIYLYKVASDSKFLKILFLIQKYNVPLCLVYIGFESVFSCLLYLMDSNNKLINSLYMINDDISSLSWFYQYYIWSSILFNTTYYLLIILSEFVSLQYTIGKRSCVKLSTKLFIETLSNIVFMSFLLLIVIKFEYTINIIIWIINTLNYWLNTMFISSLSKTINYEKKEILNYKKWDEVLIKK
jgi:hypothetical protein